MYGAENVKVWTADPVGAIRRRITQTSSRIVAERRVRRRPEDDWKRAARNARIGVWARLAVVTALAAAILWWPYSRSCGVVLWLYLASVTMIVVGGIWVTACTWTCRMARTHGMAILVTIWGLGLITLEVLPRTGSLGSYSRQPAAWSCAR